VRSRGGRLHYILSEETAAGFAHGILDVPTLRRLVPDVAEREVLLCGPPGMMDAVTANLVQLGVARKSVHTERFAY
jgi:ferredoxin-NADP reductase